MPYSFPRKQNPPRFQFHFQHHLLLRFVRTGLLRPRQEILASSKDFLLSAFSTSFPPKRRYMLTRVSPSGAKLISEHHPCTERSINTSTKLRSALTSIGNTWPVCAQGFGWNRDTWKTNTRYPASARLARVLRAEIWMCTWDLCTSGHTTEVAPLFMRPSFRSCMNELKEQFGIFVPL